MALRRMGLSSSEVMVLEVAALPSPWKLSLVTIFLGLRCATPHRYG